MAATSNISSSIKSQIEDALVRFSQQAGIQFKVTYRGKFVYLSVLEKPRSHFGFFRGAPKEIETLVGRMKYGDSKNRWTFAIFKYSSERYHPDEFGYPGYSELDGTLEGCLRAAGAWYRLLSGMP